jgi:hypothetical protein
MKAIFVRYDRVRCSSRTIGLYQGGPLRPERRFEE